MCGCRKTPRNTSRAGRARAIVTPGGLARNRQITSSDQRARIVAQAQASETSATGKTTARKQAINKRKKAIASALNK
jgi:hypothetical protein